MQLLSKIRVTAGFSADELADKEGDLATEAQSHPKDDDTLLHEAEAADAKLVRAVQAHINCNVSGVTC